MPAVQTVDLHALAAEVVTALELRAADCGVGLRAEIGIETVQADAELLRRVLENLTENAVRHAPQDSVVRLCAAADGEAVVLRVVDAGAGIPEADRARVFERFVQLGGVAAPLRAGRGLGLTFCKLAVEAHGGTIVVEDISPGAAFRIVLPGARGA